MLSTDDDEIRGFIREFELSAKEYLKSKGLSQSEMPDAYLDFQWNFLHTILQQRSLPATLPLKPHTSHRRCSLYKPPLRCTM